jgi:hypothetical protein
MPGMKIFIMALEKVTNYIILLIINRLSGNSFNHVSEQLLTFHGSPFFCSQGVAEINQHERVSGFSCLLQLR